MLQPIADADLQLDALESSPFVAAMCLNLRVLKKASRTNFRLFRKPLNTSFHFQQASRTFIQSKQVCGDVTHSPDREWISEKLSLLAEHADDLVDIEPSETNNYRPLTALKLIVLSVGVDVFSRIVPQRYEHTYCFDLFAGAGATTIDGFDDTAVVGSPVLAPVMTHQDFDKYHFVEIEENKAKALRRRLDFMESKIDFPRQKCEVHCENSNEFVHDLLDNIRNDIGGYEGFNMFSFIDPEGLDPRWDVTRRIADLFGDLLIHYPETAVNRDKETQKASRYFPDNSFQDCGTEERRKQVYCDGLEARRNTDITVPVRIDSGETGKNYHYDLIYATRETESGAPYVAAMESMQRKIQLLDGDDVRRVFKCLRGEQAALESFVGDVSETNDSAGQQSFENY